jgi:CHAT domain-containing protein
VEDFYRYLAALLIEQGRSAEAVQILNDFKDERDFDFNLKTARRPSPVEPTAREADFGARYAKAADKIGGIIRQLDGLKLVTGDAASDMEKAAGLRRLESDLKAADEEFAAVLRQAEAEFDQPLDPAKDGEPRIDEVGEMRRAIQSLNDRKGSETVVLYTLVGEDKFYALAVTPRGIVAASTKVRGARLNNKAKQLWALLQSDEYDPKALSKEIYTLVFQPIRDRLREAMKPDLLPEGATILWSLDGNLRYLPMAALYDGEKYLAERYDNVVFTRADVKQWTRNDTAKWTGVGFGSSQAASLAEYPYEFEPLPNAIRELRAVFNTRDSKTGVFDGLIFPDSAFTRDAMASALKEHRPLVHIASHFYFSPGDSTRSYLVLGDKRVFPLNEIKSKIDFSGVELLTLSACETAAQWANSDGREVDGFAELAQRLGAGAVLATLWNVRDDSSYWLMREFYRRKQGVDGETKAGALRRAQLALLGGTAKVAPPDGPGDGGAKSGGRNSTAVKILPAGKETPPRREEGVVYVEAKYAVPYVRSRVRPYAHPYFWSPFVLFGNWR